MADALTNEAFYVCISLKNIASSRKAQASANTTMNVIYFGNQNISTVGTLTNKLNIVQPRSSSAGMIAGAVIGSILGCCLLVTISSLIIFAIIWTKRAVNVKKKHEASFEMLNSPADIQSEQEPIIASDVERPVEALVPVYAQETIEPEHENDQVVPSEPLLVDEQDISNMVNQVIMTETVILQDALVASNIEGEIGIEEIVMDLPEDETVIEQVVDQTATTKTVLTTDSTTDSTTLIE
jgi:hypothetical protein